MDDEIDPSDGPTAAEDSRDSDSGSCRSKSSIARFLYNHNPFYLISCLLVIYGCQSFAISTGGLYEKSITMAGGIAAYALLMALVCVAVVRIAKVWEDARSIFIVVLISLIALTTAFDELCIGDGSMALLFGVLTGATTVVTIEGVLWLCKVRLSFWYRLSLYLHFTVLTGFPLLLGRAIAERNDPLANWGAFLFSIAIAGAMLVLIPALRQGVRSTTDSGTPWTWPVYPLSAFVVLLVLCAIRSHALWMSFGFYGVAGRFEPFLLLPMLAAVLILIAETALARGDQRTVRWVLATTPFLLLLGVTRGGATWLPISWELKQFFGSSLTVCLIAIFSVYFWMTARGVRYAMLGLPLSFAAAGFVGPAPEIFRWFGVGAWIFESIALVMLLLICLRWPRTDWLWSLTAAVGTAAILLVANDLGRMLDGLYSAGVFITVAMLVIGACFPTPLATFLRYQAAVIMSAAVLAIAIWSFRHPESSMIYFSALIASVSLLYGLLLRRRSWIAIAALQGLLFCAMLAFGQYESGRLRLVNWPLAFGMASLLVGIAITTAKTGVYRRCGRRLEKSGLMKPVPGL